MHVPLAAATMVIIERDDSNSHTIRMTAPALAKCADSTSPQQQQNNADA
jgi:hypothetical protein